MVSGPPRPAEEWGRWVFSLTLPRAPAGALPVVVPEAASLGLTRCLHRQLSSMSSEGEGQGRSVPRKRPGAAEKVVPATEAKASHVLTQEEKTEMGTVSRVGEEGWRGWQAPSTPGAHRSPLFDRCGHTGEAERVLGLCQGCGTLDHSGHLSAVWGSKRSCHWGERVAQCLDRRGCGGQPAEQYLLQTGCLRCLRNSAR